MREMKAPLRGLLAVRCLAVAAYGYGRPYRYMHAWAGLALAGLVVGILGLVLPSAGISQFSPDVPDMIESTGDLDDDDPSSLPVLTRGVRYLPLPSARMRVTRTTSAFPRPFPYLVRPQLLTRV